MSEDTNYNFEIKKEFERNEKLKARLRQASQMNMSLQIVEQIQSEIFWSDGRLYDLQIMQDHEKNKNKSDDDDDAGDDSLIIGE